MTERKAQSAKSAGEVLYIPPVDAKRQVGTVPRERANKVLPMYKLLSNQPPYTFTYREVLERVAKSGNKTSSYSITRADLVRVWGWAIHKDISGRIALISCGTEKYKELLNDPLVQKKKVCRNDSDKRGSRQEIDELDEPFPPENSPLLLDSENEEFSEGRELYKQHRTRERNQQLVKRAKEKRLRERGDLECDVCGFNFLKVYGEVGEGCIECHHTKPLSELQPDEKTNLKDIALVCANCHRMLHRKRPWLSISQLKYLISPSG